MSPEYGAACGCFRLFSTACGDLPFNCGRLDICEAGDLGISDGEVGFIKKSMNGSENRLLAVLGQDRKPIFVLTGTHPSVGVLVAFMCDMELRDFCESGEILSDVDVSPRFYRCLRQEGCLATSRERAMLASDAVGRLLNLNGFLNSNMDMAVYSNEISLKCARFAQGAASLCGCPLYVDFLFPFGIMVKGFDRGMLAAFVFCALSYGISASRNDMKLTLRFNCGNDRVFYAELCVDGMPDPVCFRAVRDAADRAGMRFVLAEGLVSVATVRSDYSKLAIKNGFRVERSADPWVLTGYFPSEREKSEG